MSSPPDLVSWWAGDGNAADELGGNAGTLQNGAAFTPGKVDQAFSFDGQGAHVRIADAPNLHFTTAMTIEAWIYPTSLGSYHEIVSKWDLVPNGQKSYTTALHPDGRFYVTVSGSGDDTLVAYVLTTNSVPPNQWTHVSATYDGATLKVYLNGAFQNQILYDQGIYPGTDDLSIGGFVGGAPAGQVGSPFAGQIDEAAIYNRALSDAEIQQLFLAGSAGKCKVTIAPSIISDPANQTAFLGWNVTLSVTATGRPLVYQWNFNNSDLTGETNAALLLNNVQTNQAGNYFVTVTNSAGAVTSLTAVLTVNPTCLSAPPGLVSLWSAEGDAVDRVSANNGTLAGNTSFGPGQVGQAFVFDGNGDAVQLGNPVSLQLQNLTIEAWIKRASTNASSLVTPDAELFCYGSGGYGFGMWNDGRLIFTQAGISSIASSARVTDTNFHHLAVTRTNSTVIFYIDGVPNGGPAYNPFFTFSTDVAIGARGDNLNNSFYGTIDELAVYNRALSGPEIQAIYNAGNAGKTCIPPEVLAQPQNQRVKPGTIVSFSVTARGAFPLGYQWRLNGANLSRATNALLTLTNVQPSQAGNYSVKITNALGSVISSNALLKVDVVSIFGNGQLLTNSQYSFGGQVTVQLQNAYANGDIFYTLDGSPPTFMSAQYSAPFVLTQSAVLRTLGYSADFFQAGESDPVTLLIGAVYSLSASTPGGGAIALNPSGGAYLSNAVVNLTATPASGWTFLQWLGDVTGTNPATTTTMTRNKTVQALFGTRLTTTAAGGGSVLLSPPGGLYPFGTVVRLSAIPLPGNYFGIWNNAASGNVNPLYFPVTVPNPTVSSLFSATTSSQAALTVIPNDNGRVAVSPRANVYALGQNVSISATPDSGQFFLGWSGDAVGSQNPLAITMNQSKTIYANFSRGPTLSVRASFEGLKPEGFVLTLKGDFGARYEIDGSSNLLNWVPLTTLTNTYGTVQFLDVTAAHSPVRFYRAVLVP